MPMIEVPMRDARKVKKLKKYQEDMEELVRLSRKKKKMEERIAELRDQLYEPLSKALKDDEKSLEYRGYRLTPQQGEPRRYLDKAKLAKIVPAARLEKCYREGKAPKPTVVVAKVKTKDPAEKVMHKLREGLDDEE